MKLRDFSTKIPPRKRASTVFNLNNELQEEKTTKKIEVLEDALAKLRADLIPLAPLPERILEFEEQIRLKDQQIHLVKREAEAGKMLLDRAEQQAARIPKYEEEVRQLQIQEKTLGNKNIEIKQDVIKYNDEISRIKNEYDSLSQALTERSAERNQLKSDFQTLETTLFTLQNDYSKIKNLYAESSKINIDDEKELRRLKTERNYLAVDNNAAREKISMLETVKNKLEEWASSLTKTNVDSTSKLAAFEQTVQNSKDVMIDMSEQIQHLMEERETSIARIQYLTHELMKPKVFNETSMLRAARLPTGAEAVHRQYIGHGKPTMLKFKVIEEEKNVLTV